MTTALRVVGILPAEPNGSDMWRLAEPIEVLFGQGLDCRLAGAGSWGGVHPIVSGGRVPDVIVVGRQMLGDDRGGRVAVPLFTQSRYSSRTALIWDCDDDLWHLNPDRERRHPTYNLPAEGATEMARSAEVVTTSTPELARRLRKYIGREVRVVPNLINVAHWPLPKERSGEVVTIGLQGSYHEDDWAVAREAVLGALKRHPDTVRFLCVGEPPDWLNECDPERTRHVPWLSYNQWPSAIATIDVGLAPLRNTYFNGAKSPIKWLEYSMVGAASIVSPTVYGDVVTHGETGLIARTAREWTDAVEALVTDAELRSRLARLARAEVLEHWTLQMRAEEIYPPLWEEAHACLDAHLIRSKLTGRSDLSPRLLLARPGRSA